MEYLREQFHEELSYEENLYVQDGCVCIRERRWAPEDLLKYISNDVYEEVFQQWVQEHKDICLEKADDILKIYDQYDRFTKIKDIFKHGNIIPFVGAGVSIPSGYPGWTAFLYRVLSQTGISKGEFDKLVLEGKYEEAAQILADKLGVAFNEEVENAFGVERVIKGPVQLLPYIFDKSVITTNFDNVIKRCYDNAGKPFSETLPGTEAGEIKRYLGGSERLLVKMHGKAISGMGRILTTSEYNLNYEQHKVINTVIHSICSKTLLFIGCSLAVDRTLFTIKSYVEASGHDNVPRHYAFLEDPVDEDIRLEKRAFLSKCNIYPIWYPQGEHNESIEALLLKLAEGVVDL